jgi:hypothetical protein
MVIAGLLVLYRALQPPAQPTVLGMGGFRERDVARGGRDCPQACR